LYVVEDARRVPVGSGVAVDADGPARTLRHAALVRSHAPAVSGGVAMVAKCRRGGRSGLEPGSESSASHRAAGTSIYEAGVRWITTYIATTRNPKGQRLAWVRFRSYVLPSMLGPDLEDVNEEGIREFRLELEHERDLSPYTVTHILSDLRCFLRWAVEVGLLERSPFPARVMPKIPEVAPRGFDEREVAVLESVPGIGGSVLRFLLGTGLRWAEACRATPADVRGALLEVGNTKSGRLRRVPLSPALREEIARGGPRIVPFSANSPGSFSRRIRRYTGIPDFHVHRCRHTFATRWLAHGGNLAVLQHILGHRDLTTTMRYARVTDALVEQEAARVGRKMEGR
jgi:integrase